MLVTKLLKVCCGDNQMAQTMASKLPWTKHNDTDEDSAEEPTDNNNNNASPSKASSRNDIKLAHKPKKSGNFTDFETKYELCAWKDLPLKIRRVAQDIGYKGAEDWDGDDAWTYASPVYYKHWWDLTEDELKNVQLLGWDEASWEHKYEHTSWADLPEIVKKAAKQGGFDETQWDGDYWPENLNKHWDDLTLSDQQAMAVLGWHKAKWG